MAVPLRFRFRRLPGSIAVSSLNPATVKRAESCGRQLIELIAEH